MDPNSALYWLPRITNAKLPVPRTILVPYDHQAAVRALEGDADAHLPVSWVAEAARAVGLPVFIRGDHCSAKHDGPLRYKWTGEGDAASSLVALTKILWGIVEDTEGKFWVSADLTKTAFLVREFLDLEAPFAAFGHAYGEEVRVMHPIAHEWRFFATQDGVVCAHPYWTPEAFAPDRHPWGLERVAEDPDGVPYFRAREGPPGWRDALARLEEPLPHPTRAHLEALAMEAAKACPDAPAWSVDFARDVDGKWWLIDMATAPRSHHRANCPNSRDPAFAPPEAQREDAA